MSTSKYFPRDSRLSPRQLQGYGVSVASTYHYCDLPVWEGNPVALDPRTRSGDRASVFLLVQCTDCGAFWRVKKVLFPHGGPDLVWREIRTFEPVSRLLLSALAFKFSAEAANARPPLETVYWPKPPRKVDGTPWRRLDYPELRATDNEWCASTHERYYTPPGRPTQRIVEHCWLRPHHGGMHEAMSQTYGYILWPPSLDEARASS